MKKLILLNIDLFLELEDKTFSIPTNWVAALNSLLSYIDSQGATILVYTFYPQIFYFKILSILQKEGLWDLLQELSERHPVINFLDGPYEEALDTRFTCYKQSAQHQLFLIKRTDFSVSPLQSEKEKSPKEEFEDCLNQDSGETRFLGVYSLKEILNVSVPTSYSP